MGATLADRLARVLPTGCRVLVHHLSTPPTPSSALYAAPPDTDKEETYCESHFLSISIDSDGLLVQVFGIEVLIYTTDHLTTLFVSKADSTGYLHLLNLPSGTPSQLKIISTTFLHFLISERRRPDRCIVLSLFARAQNQYLFSGSIENSHKHVLDDRGLIKWWCKVIDPIIVGSDIDEQTQDIGVKDRLNGQGYLRVPGCDTHETRTFLPNAERGRPAEDRRWHTSDPLTELGRSPDLPERCLIPRFPDDPKARFVTELDDELPDDEVHHSQEQSEQQKQNVGRWRSVRSIEQFWDMMSFRQECSSGRLVGFLWATYKATERSSNDEEAGEAGEAEATPSLDHPQVALPTPEVSQDTGLAPFPPQSPLRSSPPPELPSTPTKQALVLPQQTPEPTPHKAKEAAIRSQPEETRFYYWPASGRGEIVLRQKDYQRVGNLLLRLDYANRAEATDSTRKWINDIAERAGVDSWGQAVDGSLLVQAQLPIKAISANPTMLGAGLLRKKKRPADSMIGDAVGAMAEPKAAEINNWANGVIRKKSKLNYNVEDSKEQKILIDGTSGPS